MYVAELSTRPRPTAPVDLSQDYSRLWRRTLRNLLLGSVISILPSFAFFSAAFRYTPEQLRTLFQIFPFPVLSALAVDVLLNWWYLGPYRRFRGTDAAEFSQVYARLHNLPLFSFGRVFGPHALVASTAAQLAVLWANAYRGLGIPAKDYWIYWLLNLTLVPIGHAIFEYHTNGWAARESLSKLGAAFAFPADVRGIRRVGLAVRLAVFYTMLAIPPLILLAAVVRLGSSRDAAGAAAWTDTGMLIAGVAALNLLLLLLFALEVNKQTQILLDSLAKVEEGDLSVHVDLYSPDEFGALSGGVNKMIRGLRDRQRIRDLFGVYVSPEVSKAILDGEVALEGETREVSILFCDIREFTRFSAAHAPQQVVERLNEFFSRMTVAIGGHGGTINKFLGDGLLAVFGAPAHQTDHARRAVEAALQMETELAAFNAYLQQKGEAPVEIGLGIDSGEVIAGNVGSKNRLEYTVIGDPVNRSSRIEQLNKSLGTRILVSERTYQKSGLSGGKTLPPVAVKGIQEPIRVVTLGGKA